MGKLRNFSKDRQMLKQLNLEIARHARPQIAFKEEKKKSISLNNTWTRVAVPALCLAIVMAAVAHKIEDRIHIPNVIPGVESGLTSPSSNNPYYVKVYTANTQGADSTINSDNGNDTVNYAEIIDALDIETIRGAVSNSKLGGLQSAGESTVPVVPDKPADVQLEYYDEVIGNVTLYVYASKDEGEVMMLYKVEDEQQNPTVFSVSDSNILSIIEILNKHGLAGLNISNNLIRFDFALSNNVAQNEVTIITSEINGITWSYAYGVSAEGSKHATVYEASTVDGIYTIAQRYPVYVDESQPISYHTIIKGDYTVVYGAVLDEVLDYYELLDNSGNSKISRLEGRKGYMGFAYNGVKELTFYNNVNIPSISLSQLRERGSPIYEDMWKILNPPTARDIALMQLEESISIVAADIKQYEPYAESAAAVAFITKAEEFKLKLEELRLLFDETDADIKSVTSKIDTILNEYVAYKNAGSWMSSMEFTETKSIFSSYAPVVTGNVKISDKAMLDEYIAKLDSFAQMGIPMGIGETKEEQQRTLNNILSSYDNDFFKTKSLIVVIHQEPTADFILKTTSVRFDPLTISPVIERILINPSSTATSTTTTQSTTTSTTATSQTTTNSTNTNTNNTTTTSTTNVQAHSGSDKSAPTNWIIILEVERGIPLLNVQID